MIENIVKRIVDDQLEKSKQTIGGNLHLERKNPKRKRKETIDSMQYIINTIL